MANVPRYPGIYIEELPSQSHDITGVQTSIAAFVGPTPIGPGDRTETIHSFSDFERIYGGLAGDSPVSFAVRDFFLNGGSTAVIARSIGAETGSNKTGLSLLDGADLFNILCIPPLTLGGTLETAVIDEAVAVCERRRAFLLIDPPADWLTADDACRGMADFNNKSANSAIYFPRLKQPNPLNGGTFEAFVPCGAVAGVMARTDAKRGVWKAPEGADAALMGVPDLAMHLTDEENELLNALGLNCLRLFADLGSVIWGARTAQGSDGTASEWKYVPVRRLALFIEASLVRGTSWVVFEPNDDALWALIRLSVGAFMQTMFVQGALQGSTPQDAYFVRCGADTMTQEEIDAGIVNIQVGFAPLRPAEFLVIAIQQVAGQMQV